MTDHPRIARSSIFGYLLRQHRRDKDQGQDDIASILKVTSTTIWRMEIGTAPVSIIQLLQWANFSGFSANDLFAAAAKLERDLVGAGYAIVETPDEGGSAIVGRAVDTAIDRLHRLPSIPKYAILGLIMQDIRKDRKMTQQDVAASLGVSGSVVAYLERGGARPSQSNIEPWCRALNTSVADVMNYFNTIIAWLSTKGYRVVPDSHYNRSRADFDGFIRTAIKACGGGPSAIPRPDSQAVCGGRWEGDLDK